MNTSSPLRHAAEAIERGAFAAAQEICEEALRAEPDNPEALHLLGTALMWRGQTQAAESTLVRAHEAAPHDVIVLNSLASAYTINGKTTDAIAILRNAISLKPHFLWGQFNLAVVLLSVDDLAGAKQHFEAALALAPNFAPAQAGLARIAAAEDRDAEALALAHRALAGAPNLLAARMVTAEIALRQAKYEAALEQLALIQGADAAGVAERASLCFIRARASEGLERYVEAFEAYRNAGQILRDQYREKLEGAASVAAFGTISALQQFARTVNVGHWRHPQLDRPAPVFLVGYPRSGTTLLDQVLASHPDIETLEENQNFEAPLTQLILSPGGLDRWDNLSDDEIQAFRDAYWRAAQAALGGAPSRAIFIDKLPFNTVLLPLVHRLFPGAKVIFALRDPRDVVLSCFTQRFRMNAAMYHFLSIDTAARHYDAVMSLADTVRQRFPLKFHNIRYEDLVLNFDTSVGALLEFLELPWSDKVRDYVSTAKSRAIDTPSAPDVRLPLYRSSIGRWRKYAKVAAEQFSILEPWVRAYGYDESAEER